MRVHIADVCRGNAKVYFRVRVSGDQAPAALELEALCGRDTAVPCMLIPQRYECHDGRFVAVVPQLDEDVTLRFTACSDFGERVQVCERPLSAERTKWESRVNYRARPEGVRAIRDFERSHTLDRVVIDFHDCLPVCDTTGSAEREERLFRGVAYVPCGVSGPNVALKCLDAHGHEAGARITLFSRSLEPASDDKLAPLWAQPFTLRLPSETDRFTVYAVDGKGRVLPGFESLEGCNVSALLNKSAYRYGNAQADPGYHDWVAFHRPSPSELELQRRHRFANGPLFSIVVPLYRTPIEHFTAMLDSVRAQTYVAWELVLVNASPDDGELARAVERARSDSRVRVVTLGANRGITLNTNAGIEHATGDFVCFFDHDDVMEPNLLFEYARALEQQPDIDMLYCDEDHLTPEGRYVDPFFKPDFSIDLERCLNYVCHLLAVRTSLLRTLPVPGREFDGSQDHNLVLKVAEKTDRIHHVAKMLYHWRITPGSTAESLENKAYAFEAGLLSVRQHLGRCGVEATVSLDGPAFYRVDYAVQGSPSVSVVIATAGDPGLLETSLEAALGKAAYGNLEVIVAEYGPVDERAHAAHEALTGRWPGLRVVASDGGPTAIGALNRAVEASSGEYVVTLADDCEIMTDGWLPVLLGYCQRSDVGAVGTRLYYADGTVAHAGMVVTERGDVARLSECLACENHGYYGLVNRPRAIGAVDRALMMTRRDVLAQEGGFDESLGAYGDVDYCLRLRAGGQLVVYTPYVEARLLHAVPWQVCEPSDADRTARHEQLWRLRGRWAHLTVKGDPCHNLNFDQFNPGSAYYRLRWS